MRRELGVSSALLLRYLPGSAHVGSAAPAHDHEGGAVPARSNDFTPGAPFVEPEVRRSAHGKLNTTLRMQYAYNLLHVTEDPHHAVVQDAG
jgi:hypothetical protein